MIRFEIDNAVFGIAEARRHLIEVDPQAQAALTMFGEAQKLTELGKLRPSATRSPERSDSPCVGQATTMSGVAVCSCPYS